VPAPIAYYSLPNGLHVVLQEDHRQKIVALRVSYAIGSRDEPEDRMGLAHLVEHLTYRGSRHLKDGESDALLARAGASGQNGATARDNTSYYATLPAGALELGLWLESERMAFTAEQFGIQTMLLEQRIVRQELLIRESGDAGLGDALISFVFGEGHPYSRPLRLSALAWDASPQDAREFFLRGYRPDNASLVLIGDFETASARVLVERYFGSIINPDVPRAEPRVPASAAMPPNRHLLLTRRVVGNKVVIAWRVPTATLRDRARLDLFLHFAGSKLRDRLVRSERTVTGLRLGVETLTLGSLSSVEVALVPGEPPEPVATAIHEELARLAQGVTASMLDLARRRISIQWLENWEDVSKRASLQATMLSTLGRPISSDEYLRELSAVTPRDLSELAPLFDKQFSMRIDAINGNAPPEGRVELVSP
jgi:zinc protease